jgi:tRNA-dihydrouridine synthase
MNAPARLLPAGIMPGQPLTALAPMQDVTDLPFMRVMAHYGAPDYFFTEFFRVHGQSRPEKHIVRSLVENQTGRPIFAQLIGEEIPHMARTVKDLLQYPIAGIDLNMGCPAPKIYKKNVGGGLLRDPAKIDDLLGALRDAVPGLFTVKMRIGFDSTENYERILGLVNKHSVDLLSVHGRTVKEGYRSDVHYDFIGTAARTVRCPVDFPPGPREIIRQTRDPDHARRRPRIRRPPLPRDAGPRRAGRRARREDEEIPELRRPERGRHRRVPP